MKFCSKCGKRYKDSSKFCGDCGTELVQMNPNSVDQTENIKENVSQLADAIGDKAKEALSAENVQKMKDQAKDTLYSVKNMDSEKGKQILGDGISKVKSSNKKFLILALVVLVIASFGYYFYYNSDDTQLKRIANTYGEIHVDQLKEFRGPTDGEIKKILDIMEPTQLKTDMEHSMKAEQKKAEDKVKKLEQQSKTDKNAAEKLKKIKDQMSNASYKIEKIDVSLDKAEILLSFKDAGAINRAKILCGKVNGRWYMGPVYYNEDADQDYQVKHR